MINGSADPVQAIAFRGDRVSAVGTIQHVLQVMHGESFRQITLQDGQTLVPGMVDPHVHVVPSSVMTSWADFTPFDGQRLRGDYSETWFRQRMQEEASKIRHEHDWILGFGLDPSLLGYSKGTGKDGLNQIPRISSS